MSLAAASCSGPMRFSGVRFFLTDRIHPLIVDFAARWKSPATPKHLPKISGAANTWQLSPTIGAASLVKVQAHLSATPNLDFLREAINEEGKCA